MKINVMEFAKNGSFGNIHVGMHQKEVISLLGKPSRIDELGMNMALHQFDEYEFLYEGELLIAIQNEKLRNKKIEKAKNHIDDTIELDDWFVETSSDISLMEIKSVLNKHGLAYSEIQEDKGKTITFESGAYMTFQDETILDDDLFLEGTDVSNQDNSQILQAIGHTALK